MEKIKSYSNTQMPNNPVVFPQIPGLNTDPLDYNRLKNKPEQEASVRSFAMDIWSSAWSTWDGTFRDLNLIGANWDRETSYSQEIISTLGSTTAKITRQWTIVPTWNIFTLAAWEVFSITSYFYSTTQTVRMSVTGSKRYLRAGATPLDINSTNPELIFMNSGTTSSDVKLTYATTASDRPIFGFLIEIK